MIRTSKIKKSALSLLVALLCLSLFAVIGQRVSAQAETYEKFGPRVDEILFKLYDPAKKRWPDVEFEALLRGEIDMLEWPMDYVANNSLLTKPDEFVTYPFTMYDMYAIEMNNIKWPTSDVNVRRAIAYLVNKAYIFMNRGCLFSSNARASIRNGYFNPT